MKDTNLKCDDCGKFIAYDDLDNGTAIHDMHDAAEPSSMYTQEVWVSICRRCNLNHLRMVNIMNEKSE